MTYKNKDIKIERKINKFKTNQRKLEKKFKKYQR